MTSTMRQLVLRLARIMAAALLASALIAWATSRGLGWLGWALAAGLLSAVLGASVARALRDGTRRREQRWEVAIHQSQGRARAIAEVRRAIRRLIPVRQRTRGEHTRLSLLLADLLDADGQVEEASQVADGLSLSALSPLDGALVRHTRAVTHLRASDPEGALAALSERTPSGDLELDQRLSLLETYARLELGEAQRALTVAGELESHQGTDESVVVEARVVRAAALDALGRREEALVALAALGREALVPLSELGQPRVRALAKVVLESYET